MSRPPTDTANGQTSGYDRHWETAAKEIAASRLEGLHVQCPACRQLGTLLSKWEPKTPVKPLYVVHTNGNGYLKACRVADEDAAWARDSLRMRQQEVLKTFKLGRPFVLFSGGQDSTCLLLYLQRIAQKHGIKLTALHADTTAGFPEVEAHVEEVCRLVGVELVSVRPSHDYFDLAKRWGIPGVRSRWCCETLKVAPMRRYLATQEGPKVVFDGIRAAESALRAKYVPVWFHPAFRAISVSPLLYWSDKRVGKYLAESGLPPNPTEEMGTSGECWCGAYKSRCDFEALSEVHPEIFAKLVEVEEAQRGKFTFLYEAGERVPLRSIIEDS